MRALILLMASVLVAAAPDAAPKPAAPGLPSWLTGVWAQQGPDGTWVEEWWTTPRGAMMIGASKTGKGDAVQFFEHMRIEKRAGGLTFCALPKGQAGACFEATAIDGQSVTFENAANDYPQRIRYSREGDELAAEISMKDGSKPNRWRFKRAN